MVRLYALNLLRQMSRLRLVCISDTLRFGYPAEQLQKFHINLGIQNNNRLCNDEERTRRLMQLAP
jgi:hypothetical protein